MQPYRKNPHTCFEGPFGEVLRSTGPLAKTNPFRFSTKYQDDETGLLYYGYRYYDYNTGRWLSRDPIGEWGGLNSYVLAKNDSLSSYDVFGLWGSNVHRDRTRQWAGDLGIHATLAENIGVKDNGIDTEYDVGGVTTPIISANWSWHFNRARSGDSRLTHRDEELRKAKAECTNPTDSPYNAAAYLGRALHPLQDWVAHGDFNRIIEEPSLTGYWPLEQRYYWHNWDAIYHTAGLYGPGVPDNPEMDANGPDGRATIDTLHPGHLFFNGDQAYWTGFHGGHLRINKTESLTKDLLHDFQSYVRAHGKPCGECWKAFLGRN